MSEVIVITSGKGGVGKTTTVANIGTGLAALGKRVAVVDTDIGLRNLDVVMGLENRIVYNLVDVINGSCRLKQALIRDRRHQVVTTPEVSAIRDADRIIGLLESGGIRDIRLIINRLRPEMIAKGDMMSVEDVLEILAVDLIGAILDDEQIVISTNHGEPLSGKNSQAEEEYRNICRRLIGEDVPYTTVRRKSSVFQRLGSIFRR